MAKKKKVAEAPKMSEQHSKVFNVIADTMIEDVTKLTMATKLQEDLGADSIDIIDLSMNLEEEFDINLNEEDFAHVVTVEDVVEVVEKHTVVM